MQNLNEIIDALKNLYFNEDNTDSRYKILEEVENAIAEVRLVTVEQNKNLTEFRTKFPTMDAPDAKVLVQMSDVVAKAGMLDEVFLTRETTVGDIAEMGCIDSLDMVEIIMLFEEILNIDITGEPVEPETTIGSLLDKR